MKISGALGQRSFALQISILVCVPLLCHAVWPQQTADHAMDDKRPVTNDERLARVQSYIAMLEESYNCELLVESADKLINSLEVSVVGRGATCQDAIDSLIEEFEPPEFNIEARVTEPNLSDEIDEEVDCLVYVDCPNQKNQDTILDPASDAPPR